MEFLSIFDYSVKFWTQFFVLLFSVFGISSILLYGSIFEKARKKWQAYWKDSIMSDLAICQLCISVWVCAATQWMLIDWVSIIFYILICFGIAGLSWAMGGFTLMCLNVKWAAEQYAKYRRAEFQRAGRLNAE